METLADNYVRFYKLQEGGKLPVFAGQDGDGLGDILKGAMRTFLPFLFPVVKGAMNNFMDTAQRGMSEGKSAKEILSSGLKSGLEGGITGGKNDFTRRMASGFGQSGNGRKRKRRTKRTALPFGQKGNGRKRKRHNTHKAKSGKRRKVYKKAKSRRKGKSKRKSRKLALKTNF